MAVADALHHVLERADPTGGDHGNRHRVRYRAGERNVEAAPGAVAVHGGEQDFSGAERDHFLGVADRVDAGRNTPAMGEDFPALRLAWLRYLLGVDGDHDALVAEFLRRFLDESAPAHRHSIDRHLVGARRQQRADVLDRAHAAADRERHEAGVRRAPHHVEDDAAVLLAASDVEEAKLVGTGRVIGNGSFHRIAGVAQIDEIDALDHTAVFHVEAGNDADFEHGYAAVRASRMSLSASAAPSRPSSTAPPAMAPCSLRARGLSSALMSSIEAKPPDAITGIDTASASAMVASRFKPFSMPSRVTSV